MQAADQSQRASAACKHVRRALHELCPYDAMDSLCLHNLCTHTVVFLSEACHLFLRICLSALHHSRGLKQPQCAHANTHTHTLTHTCKQKPMSLHNYTCTGTSTSPTTLPSSCTMSSRPLQALRRRSRTACHCVFKTISQKVAYWQKKCSKKICQKATVDTDAIFKIIPFLSLMLIKRCDSLGQEMLDIVSNCSLHFDKERCKMEKKII